MPKKGCCTARNGSFAVAIVFTILQIGTFMFAETAESSCEIAFSGFLSGILFPGSTVQDPALHHWEVGVTVICSKWMSIVHVAFNHVLFSGVLQKNPCKLLVWIVYGSIRAALGVFLRILAAFYFVIYLQRDELPYVLLRVLFVYAFIVLGMWSVLQIGALFVVNTYRRQLLKERNNDNATNNTTEAEAVTTV